MSDTVKLRADGTRVRKFLRITNVRLLSQVFFFAAFTVSVWLSWTTRLEGFPVSRILEFDPLVMLANMLSTGYVYRYLGWGLLILGVTLLFGRVFCNWICPYGTLHQFIGWLFNTRTGKLRIDSNRYRDMFYFKKGLRVRHETKDAPARVADPGDIVQRSVRVRRIHALRRTAAGPGVAQRDLPARAQPLEHAFTSHEEFSFPVPHRQFH